VNEATLSRQQCQAKQPFVVNLAVATRVLPIRRRAIKCTSLVWAGRCSSDQTEYRLQSSHRASWQNTTLSALSYIVIVLGCKHSAAFAFARGRFCTQEFRDKKVWKSHPRRWRGPHLLQFKSQSFHFYPGSLPCTHIVIPLALRCFLVHYPLHKAPVLQTLRRSHFQFSWQCDSSIYCLP